MKNPLIFSFLVTHAYAGVTVYTDQVPFFETVTGTQTLPTFPKYTAAAAFDATNLTAPPLPQNPVGSQIPVALFSGNVANLSIPHTGAFLGFSVELSIADTVCKYDFYCDSLLTLSGPLLSL